MEPELSQEEIERTRRIADSMNGDDRAILSMLIALQNTEAQLEANVSKFDIFKSQLLAFARAAFIDNQWYNDIMWRLEKSELDSIEEIAEEILKKSYGGERKNV